MYIEEINGFWKEMYLCPFKFINVMRISSDLEAKKGLLYNERGKLKKTSKFIGI